MSDALTVTGTTTPVTVYGTFAAAKDYIASMFGPAYTAWTALTDDDQKRTLIAAYRFLDAQSWDPTTAGSFAVRDAIAAFPQAEYELAVLVLSNPTLTQNVDQGSNVRAVGAGSARVEFFVPTSAQDGSAPVMPAIVQRLVGQYLASASVDSSIATGTDGVSAFDVDDDNGNDFDPFGRSWPL